MSQVGINNSWPLLTFAKKFKQMKVTNELTNSNTGETFTSCAFIAEDGAVTLVGFSSNLGQLTAKQIAAQKEDLQVVQLASGNYKLCRKGVDNWETVDLGL